MAAKSNYLNNALLNHTLRHVALTSPVTVYVGLFTAAPTPSTSGTEVVGNAYARQAITFDAPVLGVTQNTGLITFASAAPGAWGTVVAAGLFDDPTAGNLLYFGDLTAPKTVGAGDVASIAIGALAVTET